MAADLVTWIGAIGPIVIALGGIGAVIAKINTQTEQNTAHQTTMRESQSKLWAKMDEVSQSEAVTSNKVDTLIEEVGQVKRQMTHHDRDIVRLLERSHSNRAGAD